MVNKIMLLLTCFSLNCFYSFSQLRDSINVGTIKGIVIDSERGFNVISATVSVYNAKDIALLKYSLTNNFGAFTISGLPIKENLKLIVTYLGYEQSENNFKLDDEHLELDFKKIKLFAKGISLNEVTIKSIPPVRLNGDTLEFNADAFKLQPNAVVDDLLKKLPGIIIWNDGRITVNGKSVSKILVDGKIFFGGDNRVATHNLPKGIVEKIQVVDDKPTDGNPFVSTVTVNIALKEDKKQGLFGKINGGLGTNKRYDNYLNLNRFTQKYQLSIAGTLNNVNKTATDINGLIENGTYKNINNYGFSPDFEKEGTNTFSSGGLNFDYRLSDQRKTGLKYFGYRDKSENEKEYNSVSNLGNASLSRIATYLNSRISIDHDSKMIYEYKSENEEFKFDFDIKSQVLKTAEKNYNLIKDSERGFLSENNQQKNNETNNVSSELDLYYKSLPNSLRRIPKTSNYSVRYQMSYLDGSENNLNVNEFNGLNKNAFDNRNFNRHYSIKNNYIDQVLDVNYLNLERFINLRNFQVNVRNWIEVKKTGSDNAISDFKDGKLHANEFVSNNESFLFIDERPQLYIKRRYHKFLSNRYSKDLIITADIQNRFVWQKNTALISSQNLDRFYSGFTPGIEVARQYNKIGFFTRNIKVSYKTDLLIPEKEQLASVIDSANTWLLVAGNKNLYQARKHELKYLFSQFSRQKNINYSFEFNARAGIINNTFVDSINYDNLGRSIHYWANSGASKYANLTVNYRRAWSYKVHQFIPSVYLSFDFSRQSNFINDELYLNKTYNTTTVFSFQYAYSNLLDVKLDQNIHYYKNIQILNSSFFTTGLNTKTQINIALSWPKHTVINGTVKYNHSNLNQNNSLNFTLLNAGISYRFLKSEQLELKFLALDLLRQNKGIMLQNLGNSITITNTSLIKQYYMITLSYFPRIFADNSINLNK